MNPAAISESESAARSAGDRHVGRRAGVRLRVIATIAVLLVSIGGVRAQAQPLPAPVNLDPFERQAARIFDPSTITNDGSTLMVASERLLMLMQGVSVALIVAGMIIRVRKDNDPMEGIASTMLKVAFIATIPFWRTFTLDTADSAAETVGYRATSAGGELSPVMTGMWRLAGEWMPAGSPYLDVLDTQAGATPPHSGEEQEWSLQAWNWACGVGTVTGDQLHVLWQGVSGGLRAAMVHACCALMAGAVLITVFLAYAGEVLRYLLYYAGCALLPVAIAGLGIESLRRPSARFLFALATVACWPVAWGLWNIVTETVLTGALDWIGTMTSTALGVTVQPAEAPTVATAAPFLAWGVLIVFAALTTVVCLWSLAGLVLAPIALGRLTAAGSSAMGSWILPFGTSTAVGRSVSRAQVAVVEQTARAPVPVAASASVVPARRPATIAPTPVRVFEHRYAGRQVAGGDEPVRGTTSPVASAAARVPTWFPVPAAARRSAERN